MVGPGRSWRACLPGEGRKRMINYSSRKQFQTTAKAFTLSLLVALSTVGAAISQNSSDKMQLKLDQIKTVQKAPIKKKAPPATEDILLVMPNSGADKEEMMDVLKEVHGTVVGTIGEGPL